MKFISRKKRKVLEEKLSTLDESSDEAKEIRAELGWGDPAVEVPPTVKEPAPPAPPKKTAPKPKATKTKTTKKKAGLFGKKASTKK